MFLKWNLCWPIGSGVLCFFCLDLHVFVNSFSAIIVIKTIIKTNWIRTRPLNHTKCINHTVLSKRPSLTFNENKKFFVLLTKSKTVFKVLFSSSAHFLFLFFYILECIFSKENSFIDSMFRATGLEQALLLYMSLFITITCSHLCLPFQTVSSP